jgi:hypothetical protein
MRIRQTGAGESAATARAGRRWWLPGYALIWAGSCGLALATLTYSASAQEAVSPEASQATGQSVRNQAYTRLARSCLVDYRRLCPDQDAGTPPTPRATLLCLKFYKTSLALGCRNAINAVQRR